MGRTEKNWTALVWLAVVVVYFIQRSRARNLPKQPGNLPAKAAKLPEAEFERQNL
jgi:hypothetical protein